VKGILSPLHLYLFRRLGGRWCLGFAAAFHL
jgi:hypothetical protein